VSHIARTAGSEFGDQLPASWARETNSESTRDPATIPVGEPRAEPGGEASNELFSPSPSRPTKDTFGSLSAASPAEIVEPTIARLRERSRSFSPSSPAPRRGSGHQNHRRAEEQQTRRRVVEAGQRLFDLGWAWEKIADRLQVAGRTLRRWCHDLLRVFHPPLPLGRPVVRSPRNARNEVIYFLDAFGPRVGVPTLQSCFPAMCRAELDDLLKRYRRVWRERHREPLRVLHWPVAGRVWAIDYAKPLTPIDGDRDCLLAVRDLATGMQLLWLPVEAATGENAAHALATLFVRFGAPLVLKSDNGGHFTCPAVQDLLCDHQVECLFSPPYWPRYNGAIEAGIGALKERTDERAARASHPGHWTWDDTAGALREANASARPHGPKNPTPDEHWANRSPILDDERSTFRARVQGHLAEEKRQIGSCVDATNDVWSERAMAREAIRLALEERGYLHYTRRRIPQPIRRRKAASNP
jgi:transposase InsO family protein